MTGEPQSVTLLNLMNITVLIRTASDRYTLWGGMGEHAGLMIFPQANRDSQDSAASDNGGWTSPSGPALTSSAAISADAFPLSGRSAPLDSFLQRADPFWDKGEPGRLVSGHWPLASKSGDDIAMQAVAVNLYEHRLLLLAEAPAAANRHMGEGRRWRELTAHSHKLERLIQALRESESRFRALFEYAPLGIVLQNSQGRFIQVNEAFEKLTGYSAGDLKCMRIEDMIHPDEREDFQRHFQEILSGRRSHFRAESRCVRTDGSIIWVDIAASVARGVGGQWVHAFSMVEDITERRRAEIERMQREKLQGVIEMAGAACHQLGQPLQTIMGLSDILLMSTDYPDEFLREALQKISTQTARMGRIIKKLNSVTTYETMDYIDGLKIVDIDRATGCGEDGEEP